MEAKRKTSPRRIWYALLICLAFYGIDSLVGASGPRTPSPAEQENAARKAKALAYLQEKATYLHDAMWDGKTLYASMYNKTGSENGYAMTTCEFLRDVGAEKDVTVRILDAQMMMADHKLVQIGKYQCSRTMEEQL